MYTDISLDMHMMPVLIELISRLLWLGPLVYSVHRIVIKLMAPTSFDSTFRMTNAFWKT